MKRSGFKRPQLERKPQPVYRLARPCPSPMAGEEARPQPKEEPVRSEAYRRLVADLPCIRCGVEGYSQAAHPNTGKGLGIKASDALCFPLCADRPGELGCHSAFDQGAALPKEARREFEIHAARETQRVITEAGDWPAGLERMEA